MEAVPQREEQEEEQDQVKQGEHVEGEEYEPIEEEEVKHEIPAPSPPLPAAMVSPPPSSSAPRPTIRSDDESDSPPHPIDSPSDSSLSSVHSSISCLSSVKDQAPQVEREPPSPSTPEAVVSVKRSVRDSLPPLVKVDPMAVDGPEVKQWDGEAPNVTMVGRGGRRAGDGEGVAGGLGGGVGGVGGRRLRPNLSILKRARRESMVMRAQLISRVCGCVFCLVAFSVMAADKDRGWALDSFYRYKEFRFCLAVDTIGFVYSGLQAYGLAYTSATGKYLIRPYLNFSLDQALSYLLISATSSAATRVEDWQLNWGKDKFPQMATASVALTALAFLSFAVSSIISFYTLCALRS
ncbi:hypothetical protein SAY86_026154 [Trapa natans]|uniref:CASP-like protein n=1 Tax=Trapa natans TaxID=22666 RepID=A0AAN7QEG9_TRANT|nr:hypothetical protein SAY86_026154 [Trapa natans]